MKITKSILNKCSKLANLKALEVQVKSFLSELSGTYCTIPTGQYQGRIGQIKNSTTEEGKILAIITPLKKDGELVSKKYKGCNTSLDISNSLISEGCPTQQEIKEGFSNKQIKTVKYISVYKDTKKKVS